MHKLKINCITLHDEQYPELLKNIYDPPSVLYCKGTIKKREKALAVVGSRSATSYGLSMAEKISYELSGFGFSIISGMARGIDTYAHKGALEAGGRTVAILGCGPDMVYPVENLSLMRQIENSGAVISEYLPGIAPLSCNFPARNRVISGISLGVIVVEAGKKSGSLITASFALEQGREVFAVPGNADSPNSQGTNRLIREGAKIVTGIEDILEELQLFDLKKNAKKPRLKMKDCKQMIIEGLCGDERKIAECLGAKTLHVDEIVRRSGLSAQIVSSMLIMMELKGVVEQSPGKIFSLKAR